MIINNLDQLIKVGLTGQGANPSALTQAHDINMDLLSGIIGLLVDELNNTSSPAQTQPYTKIFSLAIPTTTMLVNEPINLTDGFTCTLTGQNNRTNIYTIFTPMGVDDAIVQVEDEKNRIIGGAIVTKPSSGGKIVISTKSMKGDFKVRVLTTITP